MAHNPPFTRTPKKANLSYEACHVEPEQENTASKAPRHMTLLQALVGLVPLGVQIPAHLFWCGLLLPGELLPCKDGS